MHSALKKDGKALYEYAREGIDVERAPRDVTIRSLSVTALEADLVRIVATVSKGTYIRTLGEDIGEALGCGAHLRSLRRLATGDFGVARCVTLDALEAMDEMQRHDLLLPAEALVAGHGRVTLGTEDAARFLSGLRRRGEWADADEVAVFGSQPAAFLGTAHVRARELIPGRLLNPIEIQQILLNAPVNATFCETTP
jgi:tRNA pseudouridine55 synthase